MGKHVRWLSLSLVPLLLAACGLLPGGVSPVAEGEVLPTTTPEPVEATAEPTQTSLPPPTVTPFPSVTPEGGVPQGPETPAEQSTAETPAGGSPSAEPTVSFSSVPGIPSNVPVGPRKYFADFTSGTWYTTDEQSVKADQALGGYLWQIGPVDAFWINTGTLDLADFYAQVKVDVQRCPQDANYGLRFRLVDSGTYYAYLVWCNDTYSVGSESAETGEHGTIVSRTELPASLAGKAESQRVLGVMGQGASFSLYLDGVEIVSFEDALLPSGDIAMWARAGESAVRLVWDDLEVYELK